VKKVFPVIIVLITFSLIGTIYVQYSWLRTMLADKQEEFKRNVYASMNEVGEDLMEQRSAVPALKSFRSRPGFKWPSAEFNMELMRPPTISQKFTWYVVEEKLRRALAGHGLKDLKFEFAIASGNTSSLPELKSKGFMKEAEKDDSVNSLMFIYPFQAPPGSDLENLVQEETMYMIVPDVKGVALDQMHWMILGAGFFTLMIIAAFYVTVSALLRQKKMSEIKNDFINNMTHEFKTPLATISLAVDALRNEKVIEDRTKMNYFSGIIKEENKRMNKHVETILQAALMDRQEVQLNKTPLDVHILITEVLDNYTLQLADKNGKVELQLNAKNDLIDGDEVHFRNLISNLIDNAVKYSREDLLLKITTHSTAKNLVIRFEDNGIGMSKETVRKIFEKFYRAHTGNIHNVKGFGLGLSYVKTIIDAHHGRIKVDSIQGRGSTFTLELPLLKDKDHHHS
jgi:two-component system, OmpR family, phosphate regulon sensor histidine kinase PhoR